MVEIVTIPTNPPWAGGRPVTVISETADEFARILRLEGRAAREKSLILNVTFTVWLIELVDAVTFTMEVPTIAPLMVRMEVLDPPAGRLTCMVLREALIPGDTYDSVRFT